MAVSGRAAPLTFWISGTAESKANSRRIVKFGNVSRSIKSDKALIFQRDFQRQCPVLSPMFEEDLHIDLDIYYPDRRRDMDESLILDAMQKLIYPNDRQVKSRRVRWGLCKSNPGVRIHIRLAGPEDYADLATFGGQV